MAQGKRIGFIGTGIMGLPMALNLLKAGYEIAAYNRSSASVDELKQAGARGCKTAAQAAAGADMVITMLPADPEVRSVYFDREGVFAGAEAGALLVDMSTVSPALAEELGSEAKGRKLRFLDAPVSGGDAGARQGTLSIMVGGEADDYAAALPIFEVLGGQVRHVGPHSAGQAVKAANQIVVGAVVSALSEALLVAESRGVDPADVLDVLDGGLAATKVAEVRRTNYLERDFKPGFRARLHLKDLRIALATGDQAGLSLKVTETVRDLFERLVDQGDGELDHTAVISLNDPNTAAAAVPQ